MEDKFVCAWGWGEVMVSVFTIVKRKAIDIPRAVEKQTLKHTSELLLLLSCFSRVWLFVTPWTAAHQAPPPMGFPRQECWRGVPLPSPPPVSTHSNLGTRSVACSSFRCYHGLCMRVCVLDTGKIAEGDPIFCSLFEQKLLRSGLNSLETTVLFSSYFTAPISSDFF